MTTFEVLRKFIFHPSWDNILIWYSQCRICKVSNESSRFWKFLKVLKDTENFFKKWSQIFKEKTSGCGYDAKKVFIACLTVSLRPSEWSHSDQHKPGIRISYVDSEGPWRLAGRWHWATSSPIQPAFFLFFFSFLIQTCFWIIQRTNGQYFGVIILPFRKKLLFQYLLLTFLLLSSLLYFTVHLIWWLICHKILKSWL